MHVLSQSTVPYTGRLERLDYRQCSGRINNTYFLFLYMMLKMRQIDEKIIPLVARILKIIVTGG